MASINNFAKHLKKAQSEIKDKNIIQKKNSYGDKIILKKYSQLEKITLNKNKVTTITNTPKDTTNSTPKSTTDDITITYGKEILKNISQAKIEKYKTNLANKSLPQSTNNNEETPKSPPPSNLDKINFSQKQLGKKIYEQTNYLKDPNLSENKTNYKSSETLLKQIKTNHIINSNELKNIKITSDVAKNNFKTETLISTFPVNESLKEKLINKIIFGTIVAQHNQKTLIESPLGEFISLNLKNAQIGKEVFLIIKSKEDLNPQQIALKKIEEIEQMVPKSSIIVYGQVLSTKAMLEFLKTTESPHKEQILNNIGNLQDNQIKKLISNILGLNDHPQKLKIGNSSSRVKLLITYDHKENYPQNSNLTKILINNETNKILVTNDNIFILINSNIKLPYQQLMRIEILENITTGNEAREKIIENLYSKLLTSLLENNRNDNKISEILNFIPRLSSSTTNISHISIIKQLIIFNIFLNLIGRKKEFFTERGTHKAHINSLLKLISNRHSSPVIDDRGNRWNSTTIPLLDNKNNSSSIHIYSFSKKNNKSQNTPEVKKFIVNVQLSSLGKVQIYGDTFIQEKLLTTKISTEKEIPSKIKTIIDKNFTKILARYEYKGKVSFNTSTDFVTFKNIH